MPQPLSLGPTSHYLMKCHNGLWTVSDDISKVVLDTMELVEVVLMIGMEKNGA